MRRNAEGHRLRRFSHLVILAARLTSSQLGPINDRGSLSKVQFLVLGAGVLLVLLLIVVIFAQFHREGMAPPASISPQEQQTIDMAISLAEKNWSKISKLSFNCVSFGGPDRSSKGELRIDVRELHNATCGGDPNTAPHVTTLTINLTSGRVSYEALVDGEFKDVPLN